MLNELRSLERGLAAYGIAAVARHPDLSSLSKGDLIRVRLGETGAIAEVELLQGRDRPEIWTLRDGKHNGFPGVKISRGLLALDEAGRAAHGEVWRTAKNGSYKRAELLRLIAETPLAPDLVDWPKPGYRRRIAERLADLSSLAQDAETAAVPATCERFLRAVAEQPPFLQRLLDLLMQRVREEDEAWLDPVRKLLNEPGSLAMDVSRDCLPFRRDAGDVRQIGPVSAALQAPQGKPRKSSRPGADCALSGPSEHLLDGSFPQPTLPSIGISFLFSRNSDIPAMARYGRSGPQSMPVDADLAGRLSGAIATITAPERFKKTWGRLPAEAGDKQDLVIAYVAAGLDLMPGMQDDDTETETGVTAEAEIENTAETFLAFYEGLAEKAKPTDEGRVLVLRAVDPANRKVVVDRRPQVRDLYQAACGWAAAMRNVPGWIRYHVFVAKKLVLAGPSLRKPLSLTALSRRLYVRGGQEVTEATGVSAAEALGLFLPGGDRPARARKALKLLVARHTGLLTALAHASRRGQLKDVDPKRRREALHSIVWIGALLFFIGRSKETYMDDTGFKLGQFLSAVDAVHMGYCADVRGGQIPPVLIGNAVFAAAGRDPRRALGLLQARYKPYVAWARRGNVVRERMEPAPTDSLGWAIRRGLSQAHLAANLGQELHERLKTMTEPPDERFRAELLLGYVAGTKPEPKADSKSRARTAAADETANDISLAGG